jgi:hypothetical protein
MDMSITLVDSAHITTVNMFPTEGNDLPTSTLIIEHSRLKASINTWHQRLGHLNTDTILHMIHKGMVKGMEITGGNILAGVCKPCLKGKQAQTNIHKETETCINFYWAAFSSTVAENFPLALIKAFSTLSPG